MCDEDVPKGIVIQSHLYMKREDAVAFLAELILKAYPEIHKEDFGSKDTSHEDISKGD